MREDFKVLSLITIILAGSLFAVLAADDVLKVDINQQVLRAAGLQQSVSGGGSGNECSDFSNRRRADV